MLGTTNGGNLHILACFLLCTFNQTHLVSSGADLSPLGESMMGLEVKTYSGKWITLSAAQVL